MNVRKQITIVVVWVIVLVVAARFFDWPALEYRSTVEVGGWPLVHIIMDFDTRSTSEARAVVALADRATGVIAIGAVATGMVAAGAIAVGLVSIGAVAIGPIAALGAVAVGALAFGSLAAGGLANGAVALGVGALGPVAVGRFSAGVVPIGRYRWGLRACDREAHRFFSRYPAWLLHALAGRRANGCEEDGEPS